MELIVSLALLVLLALAAKMFAALIAGPALAWKRAFSFGAIAVVGWWLTWYMLLGGYETRFKLVIPLLLWDGGAGAIVLARPGRLRGAALGAVSGLFACVFPFLTFMSLVNFLVGGKIG